MNVDERLAANLDIVPDMKWLAKNIVAYMKLQLTSKSRWAERHFGRRVERRDT